MTSGWSSWFLKTAASLGGREARTVSRSGASRTATMVESNLERSFGLLESEEGDEGREEGVGNLGEPGGGVAGVLSDIPASVSFRVVIPSSALRFSSRFSSISAAPFERAPCPLGSMTGQGQAARVMFRWVGRRARLVYSATLCGHGMCVGVVRILY